MKITERRLRSIIRSVIKESHKDYLSPQEVENISLFNKHCEIIQANKKKFFIFTMYFDENTQIHPEKGALLEFVHDKIDKTIYKGVLSRYFVIEEVSLPIPGFRWILKCKHDPEDMKKAWNMPDSVLECFIKPILAELFMKACLDLDEEYGIDIYNLPF